MEVSTNRERRPGIVGWLVDWVCEVDDRGDTADAAVGIALARRERGAVSVGASGFSDAGLKDAAALGVAGAIAAVAVIVAFFA